MISLFDAQVLESLRELQSADDPRFLANYLQTLLDSLPTRFESMQHAFKNADAKILKTHAHALKSTFSNAGLFSMAELCKKLELEAESLQWVKLQAYFDELQKLRQLLAAEITQLSS